MCMTVPLRLLPKVWVSYRCQNKIEKYYHNDGEKLTLHQKFQKVYTKRHRLRKKCFCNLCIAINSNLFDKNRTQHNIKCHIQHEGSWLWLIVTEKVNYK